MREHHKNAWRVPLNAQCNIEYRLQYSLFFIFSKYHQNRLFLCFLVNYRLSIISLLFWLSIPNPACRRTGLVQTVVLAAVFNVFLAAVLLVLVDIISGAARSGARGVTCPPTFVLGCFSSSCKSVEKKFSRVYLPDSPKLLSVCCSTNETRHENALFDL